MNTSTLPLHLGRLFFAIGIVAAIALSAPAPKWDATLHALAPLVEQARAAELPVVVEPVLADTPRTANEWQRRLTQILETGGVRVLTAESLEPGTRALTLKTSLDETSNQTALHAEGAAAPLATVTLPVDAKWPATTTMWVLFAFVAGVGVVFWRHGVKQQAKAGLEDVADDENPFALLERLLPAARELGEQIGALEVSEVPGRVEALLETYVIPFAFVRQKVIDRLGMRAGSEILVMVAYGERMLNRVFSAAADGHLPEAVASYPGALAALEEAQRLAKVALDNAVAATGGTGGPSGAPVAAEDGVQR